MEIKGYSVLILLFFFAALCSADIHEAEEDVMKTLFGPQSTYNKLVRPKGQKNANISVFGEPVNVSVNLLIRQIGEIDDRNREFRASMTLRQNWNDNRLKFTPSDEQLQYVVLTDTSKIWVPDLFFNNDKSGEFHDLLAPNILIRISPNGDVLYSSRISATFHCPMDFSSYPMDKQICFIRIASYAHTTNELIPKWKSENALQVVRNLDPQPFRVLALGTDYCNTKTITGKYGCLLVEVLFERTSPLMHTFLPLALLVMASWLTFWLDERVMTVRVLVSLVTLLATIAEGSRIHSTTPPSGQTKAIDTWVKWSLAFVFLSLVHQIAVILTPLRAKKENSNSIPLVETRDPEDKKGDTVATPAPSRHRWSGKPTRRYVDMVARVMFPLAFLVFNIVYWLTIKTAPPQLSVTNLIRYV